MQGSLRSGRELATPPPLPRVGLARATILRQLRRLGRGRQENLRRSEASRARRGRGDVARVAPCPPPHTFFQNWTQRHIGVLHMRRCYLSFPDDFMFDRIIGDTVRFMARGHFVMSIIRSIHLLACIFGHMHLSTPRFSPYSDPLRSLLSG